MTHKLIEFQGEQYWWHDDNISPIDHYDREGNLLANPFRDIGYAVVQNNKIMRYQEIIGSVKDIKIIEDLSD